MSSPPPSCQTWCDDGLELRDKLVHFRELDALKTGLGLGLDQGLEDDQSDDDDLGDTEKEYRRRSKTFHHAILPPQLYKPPETSSDIQARSSPLLPTLLRSSSLTTLPSKSLMQQQQQRPMSSSSIRQLPAKAGGGVGRKRKRNVNTGAVAAASSDDNNPVGEQQLFHGLAFYYIPDNDIARARKVRIAKAREHGAEWTRTLANATHVIVDDGLRYEDIRSIVDDGGAAANMKHGSMVVVNDKFPLDCIHFKSLLNPDQKQYQVPGFPENNVNDIIVEEEGQAIEKPLRLDKDATGSEQGGGDHDDEMEKPDATAHKKQPQEEEEEVAQQPDAPCNQPTSSTTHKNDSPDELSNYITIMQQYKDLPIDRDDSDDAKSTAATVSSPAVSESDDSESPPPTPASEGERARKKPPSSSSSSDRPGRKPATIEERFACHQGGTLASRVDNPNARTIEVLQAMCDYYTRTNDQWRTMAYRKAITTLKRHQERVLTEEQAFALPNVGRRLAAKIEEIVTTDRLRRLEQTRAEPLDKVLQTFLGVYGVGTAQATKWIAQGFRTLEEVKEKAKLTANQRLGIERYDDLAKRIPRAEVEVLASMVRAEAARIDPAVELIVGGSYRRGAESSGDVDFVITREATEEAAQLASFTATLVTALEKAGVIVATLASSLGKSAAGDSSKWHGCAVVPGLHGPQPDIWRRVDFLLVPESQRGAALLYFTGNDIFNRSMRLLASKKGMRLNQHGLYRETTHGPQRLKVMEDRLVEGRDERKIFEVLGVRWREPQERWC